MNQDDFKKLLEEALGPIKKGQDELKKDLQEVKDTQEERILPSVITIETEIKTYADMYKINNSNSKKLEKRIEVLEDKSDIIPPPEFTLANVA